MDTTDRPLKVLIVGAGIGGLTAAVGLRKQGHEVTILERSKLAQETGAAIHIAPNCHGILRRLGIYPETLGANAVQRILEYDYTGAARINVDLRQGLSMWQHPWLLCHRVRLYEALKCAATSLTGSGTPADLKTACRVIDIDAEEATITLEDGTRISGDLVLGADGVSSVARNSATGLDIKPFGSGKSAFRFMIPHETIRSNPETRGFTEHEGTMTLWYGNDRRIIMYPCNDNTAMNFVCIHPSNLSDATLHDWSRESSKKALLSVFRDFDPRVKAMLAMVDETALKAWTLLDMNRIPRWVNGRLALLGDAAHPFLPHQGQGGGIAIEDAASLCALLPKGTCVADILERLVLYEKIRDGRAHKIQEFTRLAGADLDDERRGDFNIMEFAQYNFGHDEWDNTEHALRKHQWSRPGNTHHRRAPLSFGPMPGPRQVPFGPTTDRHARFVTHSIRFKTSGTYLRTWFPTDAFSFASPATVVEATLQCTQLSQLGWLGGRGYTHLGLYVHGVKYTTREGTSVFGSFLPVLFESHPDPIVTGRDELGMPKVFANISVATTISSTSITCSWQGVTFASMRLEGLEEGAVDVTTAVAPPAGPPVDGPSKRGPPPAPIPLRDADLLVYKYTPAVGKPGIADAEYAVVIEKDDSDPLRVVRKKMASTQGRLEFRSCSAEELPTLHNIVSSLAKLPIYGIVQVSVEEGSGVGNLAQARRIE